VITSIPPPVTGRVRHGTNSNGRLPSGRMTDRAGRSCHRSEITAYKTPDARGDRALGEARPERACQGLRRCRVLRGERAHHRSPAGRGAVTSGAAASGGSWQRYDLGHGWCSYTFCEQCRHRTARARCDSCTPKDSSKGQLLEAKDNLQKMLAHVPLAGDVRAAVDDGQAALDQLLERLAGVPAPAGPTPRQVGTPQLPRSCRSSRCDGINPTIIDKTNSTDTA
jgi:hypothetical protein